MRTTEVAEQLGVSRQRVQQLISSGVLPHVRLGPRTIRIPRATFEAWLEVQADRAVESLKRSVRGGGDPGETSRPEGGP